MPHAYDRSVDSVRQAIAVAAEPSMIARLTEQTTHLVSTHGIAIGFAGALCHLCKQSSFPASHHCLFG